jgi:hypothetical protein
LGAPRRSYPAGEERHGCGAGRAPTRDSGRPADTREAWLEPLDSPDSPFRPGGICPKHVRPMDGQGHSRSATRPTCARRPKLVIENPPERTRGREQLLPRRSFRLFYGQDVSARAWVGKGSPGDIDLGEGERELLAMCLADGGAYRCAEPSSQHIGIFAHGAAGSRWAGRHGSSTRSGSGRWTYGRAPVRRRRSATSSPTTAATRRSGCVTVRPTVFDMTISAAPRQGTPTASAASVPGSECGSQIQQGLGWCR